jgi:hypothetical protein
MLVALAISHLLMASFFHYKKHIVFLESKTEMLCLHNQPTFLIFLIYDIFFADAEVEIRIDR